MKEYCAKHFFALMSLFLSGAVLAGQTDIKAAESIATVISIKEKCTGDGPSPAKMDRIVRSLIQAGMTPKDFETGAKKATAQVETMYPGRARPPANVCREAQKLYDDAFGAT